MTASKLAFEVEQAIIISNRAYVFARPLEVRLDFQMTADSKLSGYPIEQWLEIPREAGVSGEQRYELFAFCLKSVEELQWFHAGSEIALEP